MAISTPVPSRMASISSWRMPVVMKLPSPPPPTKEAKTAVPMALTVAMRMPVKMMGAARGSSTWSRRYIRVMPMPRPASMRYSGTWLRPRWVFRTMGSRE